MIDRHEPREARSWREERSWQRSFRLPKGLVSGSVRVGGDSVVDGGGDSSDIFVDLGIFVVVLIELGVDGLGLGFWFVFCWIGLSRSWTGLMDWVWTVRTVRFV